MLLYFNVKSINLSQTDRGMDSVIKYAFAKHLINSFRFLFMEIPRKFN